MNWKEIFFNIFISFTASLFFWLLTFKLSFTKIIFAHNLVKSENALSNNTKSYGYKFRIANIGLRDLIEISIIAKLAIKGGTHDYICFLNIDNCGLQSFVTALPSINKKRSSIRTFAIYPTQRLQNELSKKNYPDKIRKRAKKGKIRLSDIFMEFGENATITIYVYGNDKITGARKMFESKHYSVDNISNGYFYGSKEIALSFLNSTKKKRDKISLIHKNKGYS